VHAPSVYRILGSRCSPQWKFRHNSRCSVIWFRIYFELSCYKYIFHVSRSLSYVLYSWVECSRSRPISPWEIIFLYVYSLLQSDEDSVLCSTVGQRLCSLFYSRTKTLFYGRTKTLPLRLLAATLLVARSLFSLSILIRSPRFERSHRFS